MKRAGVFRQGRSLSGRSLRRLAFLHALFRTSAQHGQDLRRVNTVNDVDLPVRAILDTYEFEPELDASIARLRQEVLILDYFECFVRDITVGKRLALYQLCDLRTGAVLACLYPEQKKKRIVDANASNLVIRCFQVDAVA